MFEHLFQDWGSCTQTIGNATDVATLDCVPIIFLNVLNALLAFSGITAILMFLMGSFRFMNSHGDAKKLEGARNTFVYGLIGLTIVLTSFLLMNIISVVTGVPCILKFGFGCQ